MGRFHNWGFDWLRNPFADTHFSMRHFEPVPTQEEDPQQEVIEKQQRAAVQSKRHKQRTIHVQANKDVPSVLKNFVNRAK